ncbi:MAG: uroporphyrinogen decarboxylase [Candidatus Marinimicrobia bacterium]|nr:uroporphyrinogen decarboxylase [Candidatus Neomarinimicrobiota bacterium]MCH8069525.1 uroporphyrinogen decarboxylase [Candidatus Neomarinimicrobiota bacterium]
MNSRERFLAACQRQRLDRPPLWIMRQAGRYLPEYRALKEQYGFLKIVKTPELAAQVTLQPLQRFPLDAAILFSDILVIPEAMGQPYTFKESGGINMAFRIDTRDRFRDLSLHGLYEKLQYVSGAIRIVKNELAGEKALIGFGGSPWTLATYMVEGGSSRSFTRIKTLLYSDPTLLHRLLDKLTRALCIYFDLQINAGVDAIQIFDSWGGILTPTTYWDVSAQYMAKIVKFVNGRVPVIIFSRGAHHWIEDQRRIGADVLSLDWTYSIAKFYDQLVGTAAVQGNLDPTVLSITPTAVRSESLKILEAMRNRQGHIFNLGHGILPDAKIECVETLVDTVREFK